MAVSDIRYPIGEVFALLSFTHLPLKTYRCSPLNTDYGLLPHRLLPFRYIPGATPNCFLNARVKFA